MRLILQAQSHKNRYSDMKNYSSLGRLLLTALLLITGLQAAAQSAWRPFRPELIYSYLVAPATSNSEFHTFRVDSAYATAGGDSVYSFNRRLRRSTSPVLPSGFLKSRNNLFGALLRWRPGQAGYTLEALGQADVQQSVSLTLFPQAAVGSSWLASSQPVRTATLVSRGWQVVSPGVQDTVAVISIAGPTTLTFRLSRRYGLLAGPQWLGGETGPASSPVVMLEQALLPTRFEQSLYSPLRFFDVQPGDEFGYEEIDYIAPVACYLNRKLRRVIGRQLTPDSLIITYQEQTRNQRVGYPSCGPAQVISSISTLRWATARTGNRWVPTGHLLQLGALRLLTGEYAPAISTSSGAVLYQLVGLPIASPSTGGCIANLPGRSVGVVPYYPQIGSSVHQPGLDYMAWQHRFGPGVTKTGEIHFGLVYYRKTVNGTTQTCGNALDFVTLLPTRAAQAAALATLHPNPAAQQATLTLAAPACPGHTLRLTDALGRPVWNASIAAGQTAVVVPLAGQPAGLYLLHLSGPDTKPATWKLTHE